MEFNAIMALHNNVCFLEFVLDLGPVKRPLVACLVGDYANNLGLSTQSCFIYG